MKVVNVDVDGVLYDFTEAMRYELILTTGVAPNDLGTMHTWDLHKSWPVSREQVLEAMHAGIRRRRMFRNGWLVDENAPNVLRALRASGWWIQIVTAKTFSTPELSYVARQSTLEWLHMEDIPYDTIAFTDHRIGKTGIRADAIIDDKPDLSKWAQMGAMNILYGQPWNEDVGDMGNLAVRVDDWMDIGRILS
jgi:5'(3')-deoxyribonucleotidase